MPRAFTEQEREHIRQRLLEQGYELFSTYGLHKTNVEEITRAAGISKGAFYGFFESKEALFMEVIEQAEVRLRQEVLAVVDRPGPTPRARLYTVLRKAFDLFIEMPILQYLTGSEVDLLLHRIPPETLQEHLASDLRFIDELIAHLRAAGIPIQVQPGEFVGLLYPLVLSLLHKDDLGLENFRGSIDALLELIAAYCLGEIDLQQSTSHRLDIDQLEPK